MQGVIRVPACNIPKKIRRASRAGAYPRPVAQGEVKQALFDLQLFLFYLKGHTLKAKQCHAAATVYFHSL